MQIRTMGQRLAILGLIQMLAIDKLTAKPEPPHPYETNGFVRKSQRQKRKRARQLMSQGLR